MHLRIPTPTRPPTRLRPGRSFTEHLEDILAFCTEYRSRGVVLKVLRGGSDRQRHEDLCAALGELTEEVGRGRGCGRVICVCVRHVVCSSRKQTCLL